MNEVKPLQIGPTRKAVMIWLANCANYDRQCWPKLSDLEEWTNYGRTAIIEAIKSLEKDGYLTIDRSGRNNVYTMNKVRDTDQSASRTSPPAGPQKSASRTSNVRQADPNSNKTKITNGEKEKVRAQAPSISCPNGISDDHWLMWIDQLQSDGKESIARLQASKLQIVRIIRDGGDAEVVIEAAITRGWRDLQDIYAEMKAKASARKNNHRASADDTAGRSSTRTGVNYRGNRTSGRKLSAVEQVEAAIEENERADAEAAARLAAESTAGHGQRFLGADGDDVRA